MKYKFAIVAITLVALVLIVLSGNIAPASAKPADVYTIDWYTIDSGGVMSASGGMYELSGTIGQFDSGTQSGGSYKVNGGFWGFLDSLSKLFLPLIMK